MISCLLIVVAFLIAMIGNHFLSNERYGIAFTLLLLALCLALGVGFNFIG